MCARPYGPRRDCICRLMLDPSSKIPRVMHVPLRGLAIQTWCYHGFCTKSARQGGNSDPLAWLLITRQMALSPKSKRVIAAQHGMCRSLLRVPFFFVKKLLGEILLCVCCMCLLISFSFRDGLIVAMSPPFSALQC